MSVGFRVVEVGILSGWSILLKRIYAGLISIVGSRYFVRVECSIKKDRFKMSACFRLGMYVFCQGGIYY